MGAKGGISWVKCELLMASGSLECDRVSKRHVSYSTGTYMTAQNYKRLLGEHAISLCVVFKNHIGLLGVRQKRPT